MRRARVGARARDSRDTPRWEVPIDQISTPRRVVAPIFKRARPERARPVPPATRGTPHFPAAQNTHPRWGREGPNDRGSGARFVLCVPDADTALGTRVTEATSEVGRSVRVGCACDPVAVPRRRSVLLVELKPKLGKFHFRVLPKLRGARAARKTCMSIYPRYPS